MSLVALTDDSLTFDTMNFQGNSVVFTVPGSISIDNGTQTITLPQNEVSAGQVLTVSLVDGTNALTEYRLVNPLASQSSLNLTNRLYIPLYIYPGVAPGGTVETAYVPVGEAFVTLEGRVDVVINPSSGFLTPPDLVAPNSDWVTGLNAMETAAGAFWSNRQCYGYISTDYANNISPTTIAEIIPRIDNYFTNGWELWVGMIFFDEVSTDPADYEFYEILLDHIALNYPGVKVTLNPGTALYDQLVNHPLVQNVISLENEYILSIDPGNYQPNNTQLVYHNPNKYISLVNELGAGENQRAIDTITLNRQKNFGSFFAIPGAVYDSIEFLPVMVTKLLSPV